jgi:hypothetical protein
MNILNLRGHSVKRHFGNADVMLGARIRVADDLRGMSYHEGVVVAVEPMQGIYGAGECLRVAVNKRVVESREKLVPAASVMVVDTAISMDLVHLTFNKGMQ